MAQSVHHVFTFADYVRVETDSAVKHEFLDGRVWAMAGGSPRHAAIAARVLASLTMQLRDQRCEVFTSDLRVRVSETGLVTYPDASVVCDKLELDPEDPSGHTLTNPKVLIEVLSPSTEQYDRGEKLAHYRTIPSLREVVLISQDARRIDVWRREGDGWIEERVTGSGTARITSIECGLDLDEIYRDPLRD